MNDVRLGPSGARLTPGPATDNATISERRASRRAMERPVCSGSACCSCSLRRLAFGAWRHYSQQQRQVVATAEQRGDFVPNVRVASGAAPADDMCRSRLPATTAAFAVGQHLRARQRLYRRSAMSISAITSRTGNCWPRSPPPNSTIRSPRPRRRWPSSRRRCSRRKRTGSWPRSPGNAIARWSTRAG